MRTILGGLVFAVGMNIGLAFAAPGLTMLSWRWWAAVTTITFLGHIGWTIQGHTKP